MPVTQSYPEVADGQDLVLCIPLLIVEIALGDMHIGADAPKVVIHLLRAPQPSVQLPLRHPRVAAEVSRFLLTLLKLLHVGEKRAEGRGSHSPLGGGG